MLARHWRTGLADQLGEPPVTEQYPEQVSERIPSQFEYSEIESHRANAQIGEFHILTGSSGRGCNVQFASPFGFAALYSQKGNIKKNKGEIRHADGFGPGN